MLVIDLLQLLTRIFFVLLSVLTSADYLRHHERIRRDIALVFVSLSSSIIIGLFTSLLGIQVPFLAKIGQMGVVSQPYLLLRLVSYFRTVPRNVKLGGVIGWAISCFLVLFSPTPLSQAATLLIIVYFIALNGYAAFAFIRGAFSSVGVARHRLRFAGAASVFLIILFFVAGLRLALPKIIPDINAYVQFLAVLTVITYYLGFAPPRWLRQGWQFTELRNYLLQNVPKLQSQSTASIMEQLQQAVIRAVSTNKIFVALWDREAQKLVLEDSPKAAKLREVNLNDAYFREILGQSDPVVIRKVVGSNSPGAQLKRTLEAEMLFIVPLSANQNHIGLLLVFLEHGSLFVDDDLNLLTIFAQQTAMLLENFNVMEQQRRYAQTLEFTVQQRTEALQRSNVELRQFAYVASHDLQEPLRMIVSYLQLIESRYINQLDNDAREFIGFAVDGAKRMKNLIEGLLAYSRVDTQVQNFTVVNVEDVLDEVRQLLTVGIKESGATITNDPLPKIKANEAMMVQLLQNLVSNAMKYQKDNKPVIHISATRKDKDWLFSVKDNGIGIEAKDLERIFVIFQRLHARNEYPGTGIGLAVCKKVVEHHGGKIWVESTFGKGTTFFFTLPAAT